LIKIDKEEPKQSRFPDIKPVSRNFTT